MTFVSANTRTTVALSSRVKLMKQKMKKYIFFINIAHTCDNTNSQSWKREHSNRNLWQTNF